MNDKLFRKKSIEKMSSPEQLTDYIKVTNPGVWMLLASIALLLIGICIWGLFGTLETKMTVGAESKDGQMVLYVKEGDIDSVREGMSVTVDDAVCAVAEIPANPISVSEKISEYARHTGELSLGEWVYIVKTDGRMEDGAYRAQIVVDSVSPLHFVFN